MSPLGTGRCALYHRGSRLDQDPKAAMRHLLASAERLGLRVVLNVEETGIGGEHPRRRCQHRNTKQPCPIPS